MTAAYRLRGLGWFASCVVIALGFYLVSLQVAAERKKVADMDGAIVQTMREIRALEIEFDARASFARLHRFNQEALALAAPRSEQYVRDASALAAIDLRAPSAILPPATQPAPPPAFAQLSRSLSAPDRARVTLASVQVRPRPLRAEPGAERPNQKLAMLGRPLLSEATLAELRAGSTSAGLQ